MHTFFKVPVIVTVVLTMGCNPEPEGWNDWGCPEIYGNGTTEQARELAIEYDEEEYESFVNQYGDPIDAGYFGYDNGGEDYLNEYIFLFDEGNNQTGCYHIDMDGNCVTYWQGCNMWNNSGWGNTTIEECDCTNGSRIN